MPRGPTAAFAVAESTQRGENDTAERGETGADSALSRTLGGRGFALWATITLMLVGAVLGAQWQAARGTTHEATGRVAFIEDVGFGNLDAERSLIVDDGSAAEVGRSVDGVEAVELIVPASRSYIDIVITADSERAALTATDAVSAQLIAADRAIRTSDIEATLADLAMSIQLLDDDLEALNTSIVAEAEAEADANALLEGELSADERRDVSLAARLANDEFWALTRERNALLDLRNSYVRTQTSNENDLRTVGNLRVVAESSITPSGGLDPELSAPLGGALLGLGIGLFGFWTLRRQRYAGS